MPWDPCYLLVLRVYLGILGSLWYQEYALVSMVSIAMLVIIWQRYSIFLSRDPNGFAQAEHVWCPIDFSYMLFAV